EPAGLDGTDPRARQPGPAGQFLPKPAAQRGGLGDRYRTVVSLPWWSQTTPVSAIGTAFVHFASPLHDPVRLWQDCSKDKASGKKSFPQIDAMILAPATTVRTVNRSAQI